MNKDETNTIDLTSFEELKNKMKTMEFSVNWTVTPEIGPEWIGSSRTIEFQLGNFTLSETDFCKKLENKLIELIPIPKTSENHYIYGDGDITLKGEKLEIHYDWDSNILYQDPDESDEGILILYP